MINFSSLKAFFIFLKAYPKLRLNLIFFLFILCFIPLNNHYYQINFPSNPPVVKAHQLNLPEPQNYPLNIKNQPAPFLTARSALVVDVQTKAILYQKNPDLKLLPASTTKIATALVALDVYDLNEIITINSVSRLGQTMKLELGEQITVENLLYGLLVQSGNDAATALAQNYPQGEDAFIKKMNQLVLDLGLKDTQFTNAAGLDAFGHYTTAHDLSLLSAHAMQDPVFSKMVSIMGITVSDIHHTINHQLETINQLLGQVPGLKGVKTGWTELAGECLVTYTSRQDFDVITVVLGSADRFGETSALIDWAYSAHQHQTLPPATRQSLLGHNHKNLHRL